MIFREIYVKKIMAFTDTPFVKVITGVRRCGKSTIIQTMHIANFLLSNEY